MFENIELSKPGQRKSALSRQKRIAIKRKFGAGGEGENHKRLKERIAKNLNQLG